MPRTRRVLAADLTLGDIRRLLAAKEKMVALEERKTKLESELAEVDAALRKLTAGAMPATARVGRKPGPKPGRKAARPVAKKRGRRKVARTGAKQAARTPQKGRGGKVRPGGTLQEVVAALIRENGKPMEFQAILGAITSRKLVKTRSENFANVLRRTLSTSTVIKHVARGTYGL